MKKFLVFLVVTLVVGATSCEKGDRFEDPETGGVLLLELRLPVDAGSNSGLVVHAKTTNNFSCLGYSIDTEKYQNEGGVGIHYRGIIEPDGPCAAAIGPATSNAYFHNLTNGVHPFAIQYLGETISGKLDVSASRYKLKMEESDVVRVVVDEVARITPQD